MYPLIGPLINKLSLPYALLGALAVALPAGWFLVARAQASKAKENEPSNSYGTHLSEALIDLYVDSIELLQACFW